MSDIPPPTMRTMFQRIRTLAFPVLLMASPLVAPAQERAVHAIDPRCAIALVQTVERLYTEGKHRESLACLTEHLTHSPRDHRALLGAARAALVLGYAEAEVDSAKAWLHRSISYGRQSLALDPSDPDGLYLTLAAKGQLALVESPVASARLAREVEHDAAALLAQHPEHAGAHNALGRIYFQIASLPAAVRFVARAWLGRELSRRVSWEAAEHHLRRAVELQPERNYHVLDLGVLMFARGRFEEARRTLQASLDVPLETPQQEGFRRQARALLQEIRRRTGTDPYR